MTQIDMRDFAPVEATKRKPIGQMSPKELAGFRRDQAAGKRWNTQNPVHPDNIIAHWNRATEGEKRSGMEWYKDAHEMTKHIAHDTGHDMATAAGLMSNYSPQTHWATNMMNASKAMRGHRGIGGKGSGVLASDNQRKAANRLMGAEGSPKEHYDDVLSGPKTHAFAHLIEHGGNADPSKPKVVVDRHALSVASGKRATDMAYEQSGLGGKKRYAQVSNAYHAAAAHISKHTGQKVEAHQVQAATWLVRQRLNSAEDKKQASVAEMGRRATSAWHQYAGEHHPLVMGKEPGTGYDIPKDAPDDVKHSQDLHDEGVHGAEVFHSSHVPPTNPRRKDRLAGLQHEAYGETRAPSAVDTLREENCPVCGESDAYDGDQCQVCGFVTPPEMFRDPDLDKARLLDLRNGDPVTGDLNGVDHDLPPVDPDEADDEDDEDGVVDVETRGLGDQASPGDPGTLDGSGPDVDPEAATGHVNQGGEPFTPGPNAPTPAQPMDPLDPEEADEVDDEDAADQAARGEADDGQADAPEPGEGEPGTPGDGVPDLLCPACGYEADAATPTSTPGNAQLPADQGDGETAGDVCPQCQQATLMSYGEIEQMTGQQ